MAQSSQDIIDKSQQIMDRLLSSTLLDSPKRIMLYKDFKKEVQTSALINYLLERNIEVVLPRVSNDFTTMHLYLISSNEDMELSSYGILEPIPAPKREVTADTLDLILAPGVGFTKDCYRIGYGGGFYDKMLEGISNVKVCALAFECQIVESLPIEPHDQQLDMLITEKAIYTK